MAYKDKRKRLIIDLLPQDHEEIRKRAKYRNESIYKWVIDALAAKLKEELKYE